MIREEWLVDPLFVKEGKKMSDVESCEVMEEKVMTQCDPFEVKKGSAWNDCTTPDGSCCGVTRAGGFCIGCDCDGDEDNWTESRLRVRANELGLAERGNIGVMLGDVNGSMAG